MRNRELPLEDFLTKQTLKESLDEYRERVDSGQRTPAAAYEAVIASGMTTTRGDRVAFYVASPPDGGKKNLPAYKRAKLATASTNGDCDVLDVEVYVKKLLHTARMFDAFAPRRPALIGERLDHGTRSTAVYCPATGTLAVFEGEDSGNGFEGPNFRDA